ncbi:MAG TPA: hypothetical protein VG944_13955 [Fimbriimonas sp.]|nr:hypothetical protein [Fimbriimonas sp.]
MWSVAEWMSWRDSAIQAIFAPSSDSGIEGLLHRELVSGRCAAAYEFMQPCLQDPGFLKDPERNKALSHFVEFIRAQQFNRDGHLLGMDVSDREYWSFAQASAEFPPLLRSQPFLQDMSDPKTYRQALEMIDAHNKNLPNDQKWATLAYRSGFIKSADQTTYGRLLIVVSNEQSDSGERIDRWIQFAIAVPGEAPDTVIRSVSMIVVRRRAGELGHRALMLDFMRQKTPEGDFSFVPTALMDHSPSKNCYDCHKASTIPIHPKVVYAFDGDGKIIPDPQFGDSTVRRLNGRIKGYGRGDLSHMESSAYGPCLSSGKPVTDEFIASATQDAPIPASSYSKVRQAMVCSSCHDGFAPINYPQAVRTWGDVNAFERKMGLVQTYVEGGYMPPKSTLTPAERHALWECLMKQYFDPATETGTLIDWLKGGS